VLTGKPLMQLKGIHGGRSAAPLQIEEKGRPDLYAARSMRARISLTFHAAIRGPSILLGFGNLPSEIP
jgi:hypothetical protein